VKDKLTPLVMFKRKPDGRIARNCCGMPSSMHFVCQEKVWMNHRVFKYWINEDFSPLDLGRESKNTYVLMDDFFSCLEGSSCDLIQCYGTVVGFILGGTASYLHVMNAGVKEPFKDHIRQADKKFMLGNTKTGKI
jgi:DDE superfamily endonuclease